MRILNAILASYLCCAGAHASATDADTIRERNLSIQEEITNINHNVQILTDDIVGHFQPQVPQSRLSMRADLSLSSNVSEVCSIIQSDFATPTHRNNISITVTITNMEIPRLACALIVYAVFGTNQPILEERSSDWLLMRIAEIFVNERATVAARLADRILRDVSVDARLELNDMMTEIQNYLDIDDRDSFRRAARQALDEEVARNRMAPRVIERG